MVVGHPKRIQPQLQGLFVRVKSHLKKREGHGEDHPDVNHLDIRCGWQGARYPNEAEISVDSESLYVGLKLCMDTYKVANTRMTVRLTMTTMSIYLSS